MEALWQDLQYAARSFTRKPGYTLVIVLTLALGIGAVSAVFSFFNAVLLRPLPYEQSERLAQLQPVESEKASAYFSHPDFIDLRDQSQSFERMAAVRSGGWTLTGDGAAIGLPASLARSRVMKGLLYGVSAADPLTFVGVPLLLAVVAMIACWIPARRAAKTDPMTALRQD